jgi:hypothetical protein
VSVILFYRNQSWSVTTCYKIPERQVLCKCLQRFSNNCMRTDGKKGRDRQTERAETDRQAERERETDRTKLPVYRNYKIATLNSIFFLS